MQQCLMLQMITTAKRFLVFQNLVCFFLKRVIKWNTDTLRSILGHITSFKHPGGSIFKRKKDFIQ
jgi:hypothetical protein